MSKKNEPTRTPVISNSSLVGVACRASFKGEMEKEHFYKLLLYIDDMNLRGWVFEKRDRKNGKNDLFEIDYVLIKPSS
jgi:hypothetical protein